MGGTLTRLPFTSITVFDFDIPTSALYPPVYNYHNHFAAFEKSDGFGSVNVIVVVVERAP